MRAVVISLILFFAVIAVVFINAYYVSNTVTNTKDLALSVLRGEDEAGDKLYDYWEAHKKYISISASLREVGTVTEQVLRLCVAESLGDTDTIATSYVLLCDALDDIRRYERISLFGLF